MKFMRFRQAGAPAGAWPPQPWWVSALMDPYERVNVWSHGAPVPALLAVAWAYRGSLPVVVHSLCTAVNHLCSALTHIWPDSVPLEKLDHVGIVFNLISTPLTTVLARSPGTASTTNTLRPFAAGSLCALAAVFAPRGLRTAAWVAVAVWLYSAHSWILDGPTLAVVALYAVGAAAFVRDGGHERPAGLQDHHILHYAVTAATAAQTAYLLGLAKLFPMFFDVFGLKTITTINSH